MTARKLWRGDTACDFCRSPITGGYLYDAATHQGPWAVMCQGHYDMYGLPMGQEYRLTDGLWLKTRNLNGTADRPTLDDENAEMAREERARLSGMEASALSYQHLAQYRYECAREDYDGGHYSFAKINQHAAAQTSLFAREALGITDRHGDQS